MGFNMDGITNIDLNINLFIQENLRVDWLNPIVKGFTMLNNGGLFVIGVVILLLFLKKYRYVGIVTAFSLVIEFILNNLFLKPFIARPRPYDMMDEVILLVEKARDYSFPSGHTGSAFAVGVAMYLMLPKESKNIGRYAILFSVLMGFSRLYVGIHYPSDVIGGALLGIMTAFLAVWIFKHNQKRMRTM